MENFKIYKEGSYSYSMNLEMKIKNAMPVIIRKIDNAFVHHKI